VHAAAATVRNMMNAAAFMICFSIMKALQSNEYRCLISLVDRAAVNQSLEG
jgi:hypothetical protein